MVVSRVLIGLVVLIAGSHGYTAVNWQAKIHTSNLKNANTDASVWMAIYGEKGWTTAIHLDDPHLDDNEVDHVDTHLFSTDDVGRPIKVLLWHDNKSSLPAWHVAEVEILNKNTGKTYTFDIHRWIAADEYNGATHVELEVDWWKYIDNMVSQLSITTKKIIFRIHK